MRAVIDAWVEADVTAFSCSSAAISALIAALRVAIAASSFCCAVMRA